MGIPSSISFREATLNDTRELAEVQALSWKAAYQGQIPSSYLDNITVAQKAEEWVKILQNGASKTILAHKADAIFSQACQPLVKGSPGSSRPILIGLAPNIRIGKLVEEKEMIKERLKIVFFLLTDRGKRSTYVWRQLC